MRIHFCVAFFLLLSTLISFNSVSQTWECGTDVAHELMMINDTAYQANFLEISENVRAYLENNKKVSTPGNVVIIPLVFHIIHLGEPVGTGSNIHDSVVTNAVKRLNRVFRKYAGDGVDIEVEFCLAKRDSMGEITKGINRVNGTVVPQYQANGIHYLYSNCNSANEMDVKNLSRWPTSDYYNIWVVHRICQGLGSIAGFASYPNGSPYDGTVIRAAFVADSTVLAHELGHGLFLYHTFTGDGGNAYCPPDIDCQNDGDQICDTRPHRQNNCSTNICPGSGNWGNSYLNYMSYCGLKTRFSSGQKTRMLATLNSIPRVNLLSSNGCKLPVSPDSIIAGGFAMYPNPAGESFSISLDKKPESQVIIYIYNMQGKKVLKTFFTDITHKILLNNFSNGIYFVDVHCEGKNYGRKLLIQ